MVLQLSLSWNEVYETWRAYYYSKKVPGVNDAFNNFFSHEHFFAPESETTNIPLSLGKCARVAINEEVLIEDIGQSPHFGRVEVVMATHICEQLYEHLTASIPQIEPPSLSTLVPEEYEIIENFTAKDKNTLSKYLQKAKTKNKQLEKLKQAKLERSLAKTLFEQKRYVFVSIDIEAYELDHSILTEIGWSMYDSKTNRFLDQHYINESYMHLKNGKFVDDERDHFIFGTSVCCSLKQAFEELKKDLQWAKERDGGFVLVGHGFDSDVTYLHTKKFKWPAMYGTADTLDIEESAKIAILNTDTIYGASINDLHNPPSLGKTCDLLQIETWHLHNAGKCYCVIDVYCVFTFFFLF